MEVVVEKWGEEEEVAMDIDVSQQDIADMQLVRKSQSSSLQLDVKSFGIPSDYSNDFSVSIPKHDYSNQCPPIPPTVGEALPDTGH